MSATVADVTVLFDEFFLSEDLVLHELVKISKLKIIRDVRIMHNRQRPRLAAVLAFYNVEPTTEADWNNKVEDNNKCRKEFRRPDNS